MSIECTSIHTNSRGNCLLSDTICHSSERRVVASHRVIKGVTITQHKSLAMPYFYRVRI